MRFYKKEDLLHTMESLTYQEVLGFTEALNDTTEKLRESGFPNAHAIMGAIRTDAIECMLLITNTDAENDPEHTE